MFAEVITVSSEAQARMSTPLQPSMQTVLELTAGAYSFGGILELLRFAGNVRHCRRRLMNGRSSLNCIA
jgi:hypothetical protein